VSFFPLWLNLPHWTTPRNTWKPCPRGQRTAANEWYLFADDALCGSIRVKDIDQYDRKAKIGYFLGSQFEGKGIMTASLRVVLGHCFTALQLNRIELHCATINAPSMAVAARLGFTLEGTLRQDEWLNGAFVDQHVYGLLRSEFTTAQV
jgi:ribosomal-protein-serine acetyltransferase